VKTPKFKSATDNFHAELKKRVNGYFEENNINPHGNSGLMWKAIMLVASFLALYIWVVFFTPASAVLSIVICLVMGLITAAIGFNVMHDGAHGSFSGNPTVNKLAAGTINIFGASLFMWSMKHNVIHHAYTNVEEFDDDIDIQPWLRMSPNQPRYFAHRFQYIYFAPLYSLLLILWIFMLDFQKYFRKRIGAMQLKKMSTKDHVNFWAVKFIYVALFVALPIYVVGLVPFLIGFVAYALITGFVLSIVFQLAHTFEETTFAHVTENNANVDTQWAVHQLQTTANFATRSAIVNWYTGGLNFQVEHHLFPKISHIHYPAINRIVMQTCSDYGVRYQEFSSMHKAVMSHIIFLKKMGKAA
jgi:linoleoyl-CoA desaturase